MKSCKESYVQLGLKFFRMPVVIRLLPKWARLVEWWMLLLVTAKEARLNGLLVVDGEPVTADLLTLLHRNEVPQEFLDDLVIQGWLAIEDGCYQVVDHERWYEPFETEAARKQAARAKLKTVPNSSPTGPPSEDVQKCPWTSEDVQKCPGLTRPDQTRPKPDMTRPEPPLPPQGAKVSADGPQPDRPGRGVSAGGTLVSVPADGRKTLLVAAAQAYATVENGREIPDKAAQRLNDLENFRKRDFPTADYQVLADVLLYAADQVSYEKQIGKFDGRSAWAITVHRASELIPERLEWGKAAARGRSFGEEPQPYKFRPKEAS